jgi:citrate synthase
MSNSKQCKCGNDTFRVLMGVQPKGKNLSDPRAQGFTEVVEQLECTECGARFSP